MKDSIIDWGGNIEEISCTASTIPKCNKCKESSKPYIDIEAGLVF
jgi:hypothetical protein